MTPPPPQQPQTILGAITQAVQTVQAKVNFSQLALKPNARVPELWVQDADADRAEIYPLLGDRYLLGRSSKSCEIVVRNPVVSQIHLSLARTGRRQKSFIIKDENSTNGIYRGRRRITSKKLRHGDIFTLGPPELAQSVRVQFVDPPPLYVRAAEYSLYGVGGLTVLAAFLVGLEWQKFSVRPLPPLTGGPVVVYANDGKTPLRPPRSNAHAELRLSEFSPDLPKALIASEDKRFYWHFGVDPIGILRASRINVEGGEIRQGASTLTQQVARSLFREYVGAQDSLGRKLREAVVALKLEMFYSKDKILETYLNRVYLGVDTYGFEDASQYYFGKSAKDMSLAESATLVSILPAPNTFNPCGDNASRQRAIARRNTVISVMLRQGKISQEAANRARRSPLEVSPRVCQEQASTIAPYFYSHVFNELRYLLGEQLAREGNFIIETALNPQIQRQAETSLRNSINTAGSTYRFSQGAIVTLDSRTGAILALTGGLNYQTSQFNRATQAQRQPGSTFKIFAYAAAIERGISPGKSYSCAPLIWQGQRYRGCERTSGGADMSTGMALSENAIALRIAQDVGLERVVDMAQRLGVKSKLDAVPGLVLGQSVVNPLEITGAFGALANRGVWNRPHAITRILDSSDCKDRNDPKTCRVIYSHTQSSDANLRVVSRSVADTMTRLLQGVVQGGTGRAAALGLGVAGKTGTTDDGVDLWFIGYIPSRQMVTGVWLGNDDNSPTRGSSAQAAQLWGNYMGRVVR